MSGNVNFDRMREYVERAQNIKGLLDDAKEEYKQSMADLKTEIKANFERDGVDPKDVMKVLKLRSKAADLKVQLDDFNALMDAMGLSDPLE